MATHRPSVILLPTVFAVTALLAAMTWINISAKHAAADLPEEYRIPYMSMEYQSRPEKPARHVRAIDGRQIVAETYLPFLLSRYRHGDTVRVTDIDAATFPERDVVLVPKYSAFDIGTSFTLSTVFLLFALAVALRYRHRPYSVVLISVAMATAAMVMLDWGSLGVHGTTVNFLRWLLFDLAIWLLPTLFFHFSCAYPTEKRLPRKTILPVFYGISLIGIVLSVVDLISLFYRGVPVQHTFYVELHGMINDVFVVAGLLATVANFEHSAMGIANAYQRKSVYWVLFGIILGPLVYVFMILVPRTIMGQEFVSDTAMEYALLVAPITFWMALRRNGNS